MKLLNIQRFLKPGLYIDASLGTQTGEEVCSEVPNKYVNLHTVWGGSSIKMNWNPGTDADGAEISWCSKLSKEKYWGRKETLSHKREGKKPLWTKSPLMSVSQSTHLFSPPTPAEYMEKPISKDGSEYENYRPIHHHYPLYRNNCWKENRISTINLFYDMKRHIFP